MKILARILALMVMVFFIGCATQGGGASSGDSGGVKKLTKEQLKKMGIEETYEGR